MHGGPCSSVCHCVSCMMEMYYTPSGEAYPFFIYVPPYKNWKNSNGIVDPKDFYACPFTALYIHGHVRQADLGNH